MGYPERRADNGVSFGNEATNGRQAEDTRMVSFRRVFPEEIASNRSSRPRDV